MGVGLARTEGMEAERRTMRVVKCIVAVIAVVVAVFVKRTMLRCDDVCASS